MFDVRFFVTWIMSNIHIKLVVPVTFDFGLIEELDVTVIDTFKEIEITTNLTEQKINENSHDCIISHALWKILFGAVADLCAHLPGACMRSHMLYSAFVFPR